MPKIVEHSPMTASKFNNRCRLGQAFESRIIPGIAPFVIMREFSSSQRSVLLLERADVAIVETGAKRTRITLMMRITLIDFLD
jgi:hypothetical protein